MPNWNSARTDAFPGMVARAQMMTGGDGEQIHAYVASPDGPGPFPGVVIAHHAPGWDEFTRETARRFADHGFITIAPNLYERFGQGTPDEATAAARAAGGVTDASVIGDSEAAMNWIKSQPTSNGKVGIIGMCSGGRHAVLVASSVPGFSAVADCWGGGVVMAPDQLNAARPVAPIDLTANMPPVVGIFGNDDRGPSPEQVDQHEEALKAAGIPYQFNRYDGAGHGIFYYHNPMSYRPQAAMDGWEKVFDWFNQYLV